MPILILITMKQIAAQSNFQNGIISGLPWGNKTDFAYRSVYIDFCNSRANSRHRNPEIHLVGLVFICGHMAGR